MLSKRSHICANLTGFGQYVIMICLEIEIGDYNVKELVVLMESYGLSAMEYELALCKCGRGHVFRNPDSGEDVSVYCRYCNGEELIHKRFPNMILPEDVDKELFYRWLLQDDVNINKIVFGCKRCYSSYVLERNNQLRLLEGKYEEENKKLWRRENSVAQLASLRHKAVCEISVKDSQFDHKELLFFADLFFRYPEMSFDWLRSALFKNGSVRSVKHICGSSEYRYDFRDIIRWYKECFGRNSVSRTRTAIIRFLSDGHRLFDEYVDQKREICSPEIIAEVRRNAEKARIELNAYRQRMKEDDRYQNDCYNTELQYERDCFDAVISAFCRYVSHESARVALLSIAFDTTPYASDYHVDMTGRMFGSLQILGPGRDRISMMEVRRTWYCRCYLCGREYDFDGRSFRVVTTGGDWNYTYTSVAVCECYKDLCSSFAWRMIGSFEHYGIRYLVEYKYQGLYGVCGKNLLSFDFALLDDFGNVFCLVECQGEQHYHPVDYFGGQTAFERQQANDERKRAYCRQYKIPLIELPFNKCSSYELGERYFVKALYKMFGSTNLFDYCDTAALGWLEMGNYWLSHWLSKHVAVQELLDGLRI